MVTSEARDCGAISDMIGPGTPYYQTGTNSKQSWMSIKYNLKSIKEVHDNLIKVSDQFCSQKGITKWTDIDTCDYMVKLYSQAL